MADVRGDTLGLGETGYYGRPIARHQQADRHDFLDAWAEWEAPLLVIFNDFDQFESRHGHKLIVDRVNRLRPGIATYIAWPNIGLGDDRYDTIEEACTRHGGTRVWEGAAPIMLNWLHDVAPNSY